MKNIFPTNTSILDPISIVSLSRQQIFNNNNNTAVIDDRKKSVSLSTSLCGQRNVNSRDCYCLKKDASYCHCCLPTVNSSFLLSYAKTKLNCKYHQCLHPFRFVLLFKNNIRLKITQNICTPPVCCV